MPVKVFASTPTLNAVGPLWADGIHDDSAYLQAIIDEAARTGKVAYLPSGAFTLKRGLHFNTPTVLRGSTLNASGFDGAVITLEDGSEGSKIANNFINFTAGRSGHSLVGMGRPRANWWHS